MPLTSVLRFGTTRSEEERGVGDRSYGTAGTRLRESAVPYLHRLIGPHEGVRSALAVRLRQKRAENKHIGRVGESIALPDSRRSRPAGLGSGFLHSLC